MDCWKWVNEGLVHLGEYVNDFMGSFSRVVIRQLKVSLLERVPTLMLEISLGTF